MRRLSLQCLWRKTTSLSVYVMEVVNDMSSDGKLVKKYVAEEIKTTQIVKGERISPRF